MSKSKSNQQRKKRNVYGACDFATTYCSGAIKLSEKDRVSMIESIDGETYWRATQRFKSKHEVVYGDDPSIDPSRTIVTNKRFFGRKLKDIKMTQTYPYSIKQRKDGGVAYELKMKDGSKVVTTPENVATLYLKYLYVNNFVRKFPDSKINYVVTLPAHYRSTQQRATAQAGYVCFSIYIYLYIYIYF